MTTKLKNRILEELKDFPEDKIDSLIDYMHFLKIENMIKTPNKTTLQTFKNTDAKKNLIKCKNIDDMFYKLGI